jgi:hypothetical protein
MTNARAGLSGTLRESPIDKLSFVEIRTRVKESSMRNRWPKEPRTYEEAVFIQHPDIETAMVALAEMLAECALESNDEIVRVFGVELDRAQVFHTKLGHKARYRSVFPTAAGEAEEEEEEEEVLLL